VEAGRKTTWGFRSTTERQAAGDQTIYHEYDGDPLPARVRATQLGVNRPQHLLADTVGVFHQLAGVLGPAAVGLIGLLA
jgi:hypothetical protein